MTEEFWFEDLPSIEGCPELTWPEKHPLRSVTWHPSLLRESYGPARDGWMNKLYHGDNLQVKAARRIERMPSKHALFTGFEVHSVPSGQEDPKPDGEVDVAIADGRLVISGFRPENLVRKLGLTHDFFENWRHLVDSVFVDWNYDGKVFRPSVADVPVGDDLVEGSYPISEGAGAIRVKIVDVPSDAFEVDVRA